MKKNKLIFALFAVLFLSGCKGYVLGGPFADKPAGYTGGSMCKKEKPIQVEYAPQVYMSVPTCPMSEVNMAMFDELYEPFANVNEDEVRATEPWDVNPDEIEGEFPYVVDNKHQSNQVIMQNLETRVLAFCRGTQDEIDVCVDRLSCIGYERITNVPRVAAKYDLAPAKGYPARRWREGESVPRW